VPHLFARINQVEKFEEGNLKKSLFMSGIAAILLVASLAVAQTHKTAAKKVLYVSADKSEFKPIPRGDGKVTTAPIWGDQEKGAYGAYTKFAPGYDAGMHTHTNDTTIVVIKGAYLYKDDDGEKRVGPGDFLKVPGGHKHWSGGDKTEGALFYTQGAAKFDFVPAK
jgi:quercetin dioxygenase-like cupin family protein